VKKPDLPRQMILLMISIRTFKQGIEFIKDKVNELDWEEMQELVAGLLRAMGYKTRISKRLR